MILSCVVLFLYCFLVQQQANYTHTDIWCSFWTLNVISIDPPNIPKNWQKTEHHGVAQDFGYKWRSNGLQEVKFDNITKRIQNLCEAIFLFSNRSQQNMVSIPAIYSKLGKRMKMGDGLLLFFANIVLQEWLFTWWEYGAAQPIVRLTQMMVFHVLLAISNGLWCNPFRR